MDDVWQEFSSPRFWVMVVVVGLALKVVGAYLVRGLDRVLSSVSKIWANRSAKARRARERRNARLRYSEQERVLALVHMSAAQHEATTFLLLSIALTVVGLVLGWAHWGALAYTLAAALSVAWLSSASSANRSREELAAVLEGELDSDVGTTVRLRPATGDAYYTCQGCGKIVTFSLSTAVAGLHDYCGCGRTKVQIGDAKLAEWQRLFGIDSEARVGTDSG